MPVRPGARTPVPDAAGAEPVAAVAPIADVAELVGGPCDGQTFGLAGIGLRDYLVIPIPDDRPAPIRLDVELFPTSVPIRTALYRRDAISDRSHRWRYRFEREQ